MKRSVENIIVKQILVGEFEVFTYFIACPQTGEAAIIDPAGEPDRLFEGPGRSHRAERRRFAFLR